MKGILTMSQKEVDRLNIINQVLSKKITTMESSLLLNLSERQVFRIMSRLRQEGSKGIIHKLRGKKSNHGHSENIKTKVIEIYNKQYGDYGPTLFSEELLKNYSISLDHETVRHNYAVGKREISTSAKITATQSVKDLLTESNGNLAYLINLLKY